MSEHNHMSSRQIHATIQQRLSAGKPVGRLINSLQNRGQSTAGYQPKRTTEDVAAHVRWTSYRGKPALEESRELQRRTQGGSPSSGEHDHLTNEQLHAAVRERLGRGKPVGRLIEALRSRGERTERYQERRTDADLLAHLKRYLGRPEEIIEGERRAAERAEIPAPATQKPWWKFWA